MGGHFGVGGKLGVGGNVGLGNIIGVGGHGGGLIRGTGGLTGHGSIGGNLVACRPGQPCRQTGFFKRVQFAGGEGGGRAKGSVVQLAGEPCRHRC